MIARYLAKRLSDSPRVVAWLIRYAQRKIYFHLEHPGGQPYMDRWWLMPNWTLGRDKNGRLFPKPWMPFSVRIHHIRSQDDDVLHDHPCNYRTVILRGGYLEYYLDSPSTIRLAFRSEGQTVKAKADRFHRIAQVPRDGVWTLFIMGRRKQTWGFLVGNSKVEFFNYKGRTV